MVSSMSEGGLVISYLYCKWHGWAVSLENSEVSIFVDICLLPGRSKPTASLWGESWKYSVRSLPFSASSSVAGIQRVTASPLQRRSPVFGQKRKGSHGICSVGERIHPRLKQTFNQSFYFSLTSPFTSRDISGDSQDLRCSSLEGSAMLSRFASAVSDRWLRLQAFLGLLNQLHFSLLSTI